MRLTHIVIIILIYFSVSISKTFRIPSPRLKASSRTVNFTSDLSNELRYQCANTLYFSVTPFSGHEDLHSEITIQVDQGQYREINRIN